MFEEDDLREVRDRPNRAAAHDDVDDGPDLQDRLGRSHRFRFGASFAAAAVFLVMLLAMLASVGAAPAVSVGSVGGFQVDVDRIVGQDVAFYPAAGESSACLNTSSDPTPEAGDQALPLVESEIGQARIPATSDISITKDIKTPTTLAGPPDVFRISLNRYFTPTNPRYPPLADADDYGDSDGFTKRGSENTWVTRVDFDGISQVAPSQDDLGYRDFTRLRSNNQTQGTSPGHDITSKIVADVFYGEVDTTPYPIVGASNPDRYIDRVLFSGTSGGSSGSDGGGYRDNTDVIFGNVSSGTTESLEIEAHGSPPLYPDATAGNYPGSVGQVAEQLTADNTYDVDDVEYAGIDNNADGGTGYSDFTNLHTATLATGNATTLTASADRFDAAYGDVINTRLAGTADGDTQAGCGSKCGDENDHHIYQVYWDDNSYGTPQGCTAESGDGSGYQDYTSYRPGVRLVPNETYTLAVRLDESDDTSNSTTTVWIDWDDDGDADGATPGGRTIQERYTVGLGGYGTDGNCPDRWANVSVTVPDNIVTNRSITNTTTTQFFDNGSEPGSVAMRIVADGGGTFWGDPGDPTDGFHGEMEDYTVPIQEPQSNFRAWADWDQDADFAEADESFDLPDGFRGTPSPSSSGTVTVPNDAFGGSTLLRVTHKVGYPTSQTVEPTPDEGAKTWIGHTEDYTVEVESDGVANIKAWIDWDQDRDFSDADEEVDLGQDQFPTTNGSFSLGPTSYTVPSRAEAGTTMLRVGLVMGGREPEPGMTTAAGEFEDYTVHVDADESVEVRAWIDWDQDRDFADANEQYDLGSYGPGTYLGTNRFTASAPIGTIPSGAPDGVTLMRVTASLGNLPGPAPGSPDTFFGETEDFTVVVGPNTTGPDYAQNVTLGDATFRLTDLRASEITVQTSVIDEDYSQNSSAYPTLTRDGEFLIAGEIVDIRDLRARAHYLSFGSMNLPFLNISVSYNPPDPAVKSDNTCLGIA